ncbi:unnamed protein product [Debaryomyces tyrocola]|nr:unnamed protein product [Debaryomyces tyrocola]
MDKLTNNQISSIHLLNLSHSVPLNPLAKVYKDTFAEFTQDKCINLPANYMEDTFCDKCESIYIPGITVSIRIIYNRKRRSAVNRRRLLRYTCLECDHRSDRELEIPTSKQSTPIPNIGDTEGNDKTKPEEFKATWPKADTSKSKQRLKKRKQNNLSNLLALKKKEKENESKQFNSLSLMEFMNK